MERPLVLALLFLALSSPQPLELIHRRGHDDAGPLCLGRVAVFEGLEGDDINHQESSAFSVPEQAKAL